MRNLLNPWLLLTILLALGAATGTGYWRGSVNTRNAIEAADARETRIGQIAYEASQRATAEALGKLHVNNTTIRQTLEKEIRYEKDYANCYHSDGAFRVLNDALTRGTASESLGSGELPRSDGAH